MKEPDWVGAWFPIVESLGDSMDIHLGHLGSRDEHIAWHTLKHVDYDGVGAMSALLFDTPQPQRSQPKIKNPHKPSALKIAWAILLHVIASLRHRSKWIRYQPSETGSSTSVAWKAFQATQTQALTKRAQTQKVSLNSMLLSALDAATRELYIRGGKTRWAIPVNMRGADGVDEGLANPFSFVHVSCDEFECSPSHFYQKTKKEFESQSHWAQWAMAHLIKHVGREQAQKMYTSRYQKPNPVTGTFSSLGEWKSNKVSHEQAWIISAPSSKLTPIAAGVCIVNGKLSLALQIHPSLSRDVDATRKLLEQWLIKIETLAGVPLNSTPLGFRVLASVQI